MIKLTEMREITPYRWVHPSGEGAGGAAAQAELDQLLNDNLPATPAYKTRAVQQRVETLSRMIAGSASVVGQGDRSA